MLKPVPPKATANQIEVGVKLLRDRPIGNERRLRQAVAEIYEAMVEIANPPEYGGLLSKQKIMLELLIDYVDNHGQAPTLEQLGRWMGMHKTNARRMLRNMEKRGYVKLTPYSHRGIEVLKRTT